MADITMCANKSCPMRDTCYRAMANPGFWQSWAAFEGGEGCRHYVEYTPADELEESK